MKIKHLLIVSTLLAAFSGCIGAQPWSGILKPTAGSGACTFGSVSGPAQCAIDWTQVGIPGGIPTTWSQSGSIIAASACGSGASDCTGTIQNALNACAGTSLPGRYVMLGSGTFLIAGNLSVPNYCYLSGGGAQATILNCMGTSGSCVRMGAVNDSPGSGYCTISSGNNAGSASLTLSGSCTPPSAGKYLVISELNNSAIVSSGSPQNPGGCSYCDYPWGGKRLREQIVEVESATGNGPYTVTISPTLYTDYGIASGTSPAYAVPFTPDCKYCGAENLQLYANGTGIAGGMSDMNMTMCAFCFVQNVEFNYTDADWLDLTDCYRCEVRNNYFSNAFGHGAGGSDADVSLNSQTTASLLINNIMERGHVAVMVNGAAGNVIAYNYAVGEYEAAGGGALEYIFDEHGAYPQLNLFEGNVGPNFTPDSWHGNNGYNTAFRNWFTGSDTWAFYPAQAINTITCSSGTCTINLIGTNTAMYAGEYVRIWGTSSGNCGSGSIGGNGNNITWQLTGSNGALSTTFSAGSCSGATGGYVAVTDLAAAPKPIVHQPVVWTSNTFSTYQSLWPVTIAAFSVGNNLIGNVLGSAQLNATVGAGNVYNGSTAPCTSCEQAPTSRPYSGQASTSNYGYDTTGDNSGSAWSTFPGGPSNTSGYWNKQGFTTTFYHGNYDSASASTIWNVNAAGNSTLPPSLFLSSKPSWFGSVAWPSIGPDLTGGPDSTVAGHANYIPAQVCYNSLSRDSLGVKLFDANTCYGSSGQTVSPSAPPTGITAAVH